MADGSGDAGLTVGQAAARIGVTVRTLHHWDAIGLATPTTRTPAGYRLYAELDLERLSRIIIYRELGLDLDAIRTILDEPSAPAIAALRAQQAKLAERIEHLTALGDDLARMTEAHEHGILMSADEQVDAFGPEWNPSWPAGARQRYGETPEWRQYAERAASRSPDDWRAVAEAMAVVEQHLADAMDAGVVPGTRAADELVERHRDTFAAYFPITREMQVVLGRMYESDPEFAAHYDGIRKGLAGWLRRIIDASALSHGIDPDSATWR